MRNTLALTALLLAGCTTNNLKIDDSSDPLDGGTQPVVDMSRPTGIVDLSQPPSAFDSALPPTKGCANLLICENACTTQACITKCEKQSTPQAISMFMMLEDCITKVCVNGGPCADPNPGQDCNDCVTESTTGTSATGTNAGPCVDSNNTSSSSSNCGQCVDPLVTCETN